MTSSSTNILLHNPKILVIDDEPRIRDACSLVLTGKGFEVSTAPDGAEGLEMIKEQHYDILLVDLMMPNISGFDVLSEVRNHHPDTVVIVITGYATLEHSIEAMKKGAFDFIPKPFTPDQLRAVVEKSLRYTSALQDIADSRSRLKIMVNRLTDGVMTTDASKLIVQVNPAFLHMIGYKGEKVVGRHISEIITDSTLLSSIDQALTMPADSVGEITNDIYLGTDGAFSEEKILNARCAPFRGRTQENLGSITLLHDITTAKKMEQMKSDFVSMVSHEVRSPMNSLLMQLKNINDGLAGPVTEKQQEILQRASEKIINLNNLVTELLDLSRIESGLISHEREQVNIAQLLAEQKKFHYSYAKEKQINIQLDCPSDLPEILANQQNMEEVFSNLLTNGIKYSPTNGTINISASTGLEYLKIQVADTGFGINKDELAHIFTRFYRVKDANTRQIQGTGLGLALVKSIIESHHGRICVDSEVGVGTTFTILLPLTED